MLDDVRMAAEQLDALLGKFGWLYTIKQVWSNERDLVVAQAAQPAIFFQKELPQDQVVWQHVVFRSFETSCHHTHPLTKADLRCDKDSMLAKALFYSVPSGYIIDYLALVKEYPRQARSQYPNTDVTILRPPRPFKDMSSFLFAISNGRFQIVSAR